jgi:hypothetical protein
VVAIPLAFVDLSTCWVIVHQESYALLRHSVEELRQVERRSHHFHAVSVIVAQQCPSACSDTGRVEKICPNTPLHERPA